MEENPIPPAQVPDPYQPPQPEVVADLPQQYAQPTSIQQPQIEQPYPQPVPPQPQQTYQPVQQPHQPIQPSVQPLQPNPAVQQTYEPVVNQPQAGTYSTYVAPSRRIPIRLIALFGGALTTIAIIAILLGAVFDSNIELRSVDQSELPFTFSIPAEWEVSGTQSDGLSYVVARPPDNTSSDQVRDISSLIILRKVSENDLTISQYAESVNADVARLSSEETQSQIRTSISSIKLAEYDIPTFQAAYQLDYDSTTTTEPILSNHITRYFIYESPNTQTIITLAYSDKYANIGEQFDQIVETYQPR